MEAHKDYLMEEEESQKKQFIRRHPKILIVEDDITTEPLWEYIVRTAFRNARFDWATSELQAESFIEFAMREGKNYDLVISDIFLSGTKTGIDLWLKFNKKLQGNFILISGIDYFKMLKFLGNSEKSPLYIKKPLVIHECVEAVYNALSRQKF